MNQISKRIYKELDPTEANKVSSSIAACFVDGIDVHIFSIGHNSSFIRYKNNKARYISDKSDKHYFSLSKKPKLVFKHEIFDIREISEAYLVSDGYYSAFDKYRLFSSRRDLFSLKNDLQLVYKIAMNFDKKEDDGHPHNDISAIRVTF